MNLSQSLPALVHALDEAIRQDLQNSRDSYFSWLIISALVVVIGVVLEGPELVWETVKIFRPECLGKKLRGKRNWITLAALLGWGLVVLGVTGEFVAEGLVSKADTTLQTFNDILLSDAIKEAGAAKASAEGAAVASSRAKEASDAAIEKAGAVKAIAESANRIASSAQLQASAIKRTLVVVDKQLKTTQAQADEIRDEIAWRHVSPKQSETIRNSIPTSLRGLKIEVRHLLSDPEASKYASQIADALRPVLDVDGTSGVLEPWGTIPQGVGLYLKSLDMPGAADLQRALKVGEIEAPGVLLPAANLSSSTGIVIFVWPKPAPIKKR
jgi:hypothetical protein